MYISLKHSKALSLTITKICSNEQTGYMAANPISGPISKILKLDLHNLQKSRYAKFHRDISKDVATLLIKRF